MESFLANWYWWAILLSLIGLALFNLHNPGPDIKWETLSPDIRWDANSDDSLNAIYKYVVAFSDSTILWYQSRRQPKRYVGVSLRASALLATVIAGLVPLSKEIVGVEISAVWSTVLIAVAGMVVSIDVLGGFTSGWVRYMLAQQKVERLRDAFLLEWNALKAAQTNTQSMLERAKTFLLGVGKVVDDETQEWATEFQNALKEMEKARKTAAEIERSGAIEVSLKNPQTVTGWTLEIDGSQRGQTSGKSLAVTDVLIGIRKLKAYGTDPNGKILSDEKTIKVEGGMTVTKELELG